MCQHVTVLCCTKHQWTHIGACTGARASDFGMPRKCCTKKGEIGKGEGDKHNFYNSMIMSNMQTRQNQGYSVVAMTFSGNIVGRAFLATNIVGNPLCLLVGGAFLASKWVASKNLSRVPANGDPPERFF